MFKLNLQHSKNLKASVFSYRNQNRPVRNHQGYHNLDSPIKAAFRLETSPRKSLSPIKLNTDSKIGLNRSRSPILRSKRDEQYSSNRKVSPFRKNQFRQAQQQFGHQKHISFTSLIRKNSNTTQCQTQNQSQFNRTIEYSTSNYLQSDRNFREDTNLFKKLANMLESNNSQKCFLNSEIDDNSVKFKAMPQSCKNRLNSNKKLFIKNVLTIESIQSPQQKDLSEQVSYHDGYGDINTKCYSEYEKMTSQHIILQKKTSNTSYNLKSQPRMLKKQSKNNQESIKEEQLLSFKKISYANEKNQDQMQNNNNNAINFNLTNSFGMTINLKQQIIGSQHTARKPTINPFEEILEQTQTPPQQPQFIPKSISQSQDSLFASLQMLLEKVHQKDPDSSINKENQSINISIISENEPSELDMQPFLQKRK